MTEVKIKVGDREMSVAEARALYDALRSIFASNAGLGSLGPALKEWEKRNDESQKKIDSQPRWPPGAPFVYQQN